MTAVQHGMTKNPQIDSRENSIPGKRVLIYYRCFDSTLGGGEYLPLSFIAELQKNSMVTLALDWKSDVEGYAKKIGIDIDFLQSRHRIHQAEKIFGEETGRHYSFLPYEATEKAREERRCLHLHHQCI